MHEIDSGPVGRGGELWWCKKGRDGGAGPRDDAENFWRASDLEPENATIEGIFVLE